MRKRFQVLCLLLSLLCGAGAARAAAAEESAAELTVIQLCDPQLGFENYAVELARLRQTTALINATEADLVVVCGDLVNVNTPEAFDDYVNALRDSKVEVFAVPGNHDLPDTDYAANLALFEEKVGADHWSLVRNGYRIIGVNSQLWKNAELPGAAEHDQWLRDELAAAREAGEPVIVVSHFPIFVKAFDEPEEYFNLAPAKRAELLQLFQDHGVIACLAGHTHTVEDREFGGIVFSNGETTSKSFDGSQSGFRLVRCTGTEVEKVPAYLP